MGLSVTEAKQLVTLLNLLITIGQQVGTIISDDTTAEELLLKIKATEFPEFEFKSSQT